MKSVVPVGRDRGTRARHHPRVVGIPVSPRPLGEPARLAEPRTAAFVVTFVNPQACALARRHPGYTDLLERFDQVSCDGAGMVAAARLAGLREVRRESFDFTSLAAPVFEWAAGQGLRTGLVGGQPGVAAAAGTRLEALFPGLALAPAFSGYGADVEAALAHHATHHTPVVVCGMGAPRQEAFLLDLIARGWSGTGFTCGGFMDQLLSAERYYPGWVDRLNLRFLYRLAREPRRLWRRYLVDYQLFCGRYLGLALRRLAGKAPVSVTGGDEL